MSEKKKNPKLSHSLINVISPNLIISSHQKHDLWSLSKARRQMQGVIKARVITISGASMRQLSFLWQVL